MSNPANAATPEPGRLSIRPLWIGVATVVFVVTAVGLLAASTAWSGEDDEPGKGSDSDKKERAARLDVMRRRAASLITEVESPAGAVPLQLVEAPILRYSTPQRLGPGRSDNLPPGNP